jgi:hypothetical protein
MAISFVKLGMIFVVDDFHQDIMTLKAAKGPANKDSANPV